MDVPDDKNKLDILDTNLFAYCLNNPINMNDPNGKLAFLIPIIVTAPTWVPWVVGGALALGTAITLDAVGLNPFRYAKARYEDLKSKSDPDPYARPNQKKQGRERKEKKRKTTGLQIQTKNQSHYPNIHLEKVIEIRIFGVNRFRGGKYIE